MVSLHFRAVRKPGRRTENAEGPEDVDMGYSLAWCAVRGKSAEAVLQELRLVRTGDLQSQLNTPFNGRALPGGWYAVVADHDDHVVDEAVLRPLSAGCEVVTLGLDEQARSSRLQGWKNGAVVWTVAHAAERGPAHLDVQGAAPGELEPLRGRAGADALYALPIELGRALTGYRHDGEEVPDGYEILAPLS
jgi:hypothetical protein